MFPKTERWCSVVTKKATFHGIQPHACPAQAAGLPSMDPVGSWGVRSFQEESISSRSRSEGKTSLLLSPAGHCMQKASRHLRMGRRGSPQDGSRTLQKMIRFTSRKLALCSGASLCLGWTEWVVIPTPGKSWGSPTRV